MSSKYYSVSSGQLFGMSLVIGVIAACVITINIMVKDYLLLPVVSYDENEQCAMVLNSRNGDAYTCNDVGVILRNFRKEK